MRRPTIRCRGTGIFRRGRCAPANDRYGAVDRYTCPRGARTRAHSRRYSGASATCSMTACDNTRSNVPSGNGRAMPSARAKCRLRRPRSRPRRTPASWNRSAGSIPTTATASSASDSGMPPPPQPGVEHAAADGHPRALEKRDDLRAPVVLEQRVVVFGAKPQVRVRLDRAVVNPAHARPSASHASASRKVDSRLSLIR